MIDAGLNEQQLAQLNAKLERFAAAMSDLTPANREASIALYGWTLRNFDRQGKMGQPWVPLAPRTIRQKKKIGKEQMLVRTGALRANFTQSYDRENAVIGNQLEIAKYHHEGTKRNGKPHIPVRELLPRREVVLDIGLRVYGLYAQRQAARANT